MSYFGNKLLLGQLIWLVMSPLAMAQSRAALSQPVIRRSGEEVLLVCRVMDMNPSHQYRIGFGTAEEPLEVRFELTRGNLPLAEKPAVFEQGHASGWWGLDSLQAYGITFSGGPEVSISARVKRADAEKFERVFFFLAREYAADTWYLEDGIELKRSHW